MPSPRRTAFYALTASVTFGTIYSVLFNTYLDTSNPLISSLPHPLRHQSYFASKSNIFNTWFVKKAWGWTTMAFIGLYFTSPEVIRTKKRAIQWLLATVVWAAFTTWFFGPAIIDRVVSYSGGECVVILPHASGEILSAAYMSVPIEYCLTKTKLSPHTHPDLFITPFAVPHPTWSTRPRYLRGHDVSGHIFLLTLSVLFLADQLQYSLRMYENPRMAAFVPPSHRVTFYFGFAISALWLWMTLTTSIYWHTPWEKVSGLGTF